MKYTPRHQQKHNFLVLPHVLKKKNIFFVYMYLVIQVQLWLMGNLTFNRVFPVCLKQNTKLPNRKRVQENLITEWWLKFHRFLTQSYCMTWENIEHNPCIYIYSPKAFCNLSTIFFFFFRFSFLLPTVWHTCSAMPLGIIKMIRVECTHKNVLCYANNSKYFLWTK